MRFWDFGRNLTTRSLFIWSLLLLCLFSPLLWLGAQAQTDDAENDVAQADIFVYLPVIMTPPGPPERVRVDRFNTAPLITCAVADISHAGDTRLFVAQQDGLIVILDADGSRRVEPFLDLTSQVTQACSEQRPQAGLLSLAFHPNYSNNGEFFVTYTRLADEAIVLSRFTVSTDPHIADASSEEVMLVVEKPETFNSLTHNGGDLTFGPEGDLFVALGDGGIKPSLSDPLPGDPANRAQSTDTLLGKVLRLDVDGISGRAPDCGGAGYRIPSENSLADGAGGACDEIWGVGLRAPWGMAYDVATGRLFMVDSAEYQRNEINSFLNDLSAPNFGWHCAEGTFDHTGQPHVSNCPAADVLTAPTFEYGQENGCRVIGGQVHGAAQFTLENQYLFTDACVVGRIGRIETGDPTLPPVWMTITNVPLNIVWNASGSDAAGNVYFSEFSFNPAGSVNVYRVADPQLGR